MVQLTQHSATMNLFTTLASKLEQARTYRLQEDLNAKY